MSETPRAFINKENINLESGIITITDKDEIHYLKNVQRAKINDTVIILDNNYNKYNSTIITIEKDLIESKIQACTKIQKYPEVNITLIQGLLKGDKQELLIQKATELGVNKIICVNTDFSNVKLSDTKTLNNKLSRMKKVILNASKQSKRATIPEIIICRDLEKIINEINTHNEALKIVCLENEENKTIKTIFKAENKTIKDIFIFIGPEGGWSDNERVIFNKYAIQSTSLGSNILRAETAAILAIGYLLYEYEFE